MNKKYVILITCDECKKEKLCKLTELYDDYYYICKECYEKAIDLSKSYDDYNIGD